MKTTKTFNRRNTIVITVVASLVWACSGTRHSAFKEVSVAPTPTPEVPPVQKNIPSCQLDPVNYRINASLLSFYLTGSGSVGGGIDLVSGILRSIGLNYEWTTFKMNTRMEFFNAMEPTEAAEWNEDGVKDSNTKFSVGAMISDFNLGVSGSSAVVLEEMVQKAFLKNLKNIDKDLSKRHANWETTVKSVDEAGFVTVPVGENHEVLVGDRLNIYKADFKWGDDGNGVPCYSTRRWRTGKPELVAEVEVAEVSQGYKNRSFLKVVSLVPGAKIEAGDIVQFKAFAAKKKGDKKRIPYKYVVRVEHMEQMPIRIADESGRVTSVELQPILKSLLEKTLDNKFDNYEVKR